MAVSLTILPHLILFLTEIFSFLFYLHEIGWLLIKLDSSYPAPAACYTHCQNIWSLDSPCESFRHFNLTIVTFWYLVSHLACEHVIKSK